MPPQVLVVQMGARRSYELARMLEARGSLAALYTDAAWLEDQHSLTKRVIEILSPGSAPAVSRRTVNGISSQKVRSTSAPNIVGAFARAARIETERCYRFEDWALGNFARWHGLAGANVVLNTTGNGGAAFLRWAGKNGAKIATDVVITPLALEIVARERARWPGWDADANSLKAREVYRRHIEDLVGLSDLLLCPSETVVDGLASVSGFAPEKVARVDYGLGHAVIQENRPQPKRVLFAGEAGLRKGLPYLAWAASMLKASDPDFTFIIAGHATELVRARPECRDLTFLGHLSREAMEQEFSQADMFCLPSLAEGSASVVLEALAHGLPCVVTRSAGTRVTNGIEGLVVPEREPDALAEAIWQIGADRALRARMSSAARLLASEHSQEKVGARLYEALAGLLAASSRSTE